MMRALHLYVLWWSSLFHRLKHELGREVTVVVAGGVMFATFFYVFNDFLNVQVASVALSMRASFARAVTVTILLLATAGGARYVRGSRTDATFRRLADFLGEEQASARAFSILRACTILLGWHFGAWYLVRRYLQPVALIVSGPVELLMLGLTIGFLCLKPLHQEQPRAMGVDARVTRASSRLSTLVRWRLTQILRRSRVTQFCLILALGFLALVLLAASRGAPYFVPMVAALAAGYLVAATLSLQMGDDLQHAWLERGVGISHDEFMRSYTYLGIIFGGSVAVLAGGLYGVGVGLVPEPAVNSTLLAQMLAAAKLGTVAAVPCLCAPPLLLQIDGRRLAINLLLTLIASLFIGTAVFANWLGVALVPLLSTVAGPAQAGRFYRA